MPALVINPKSSENKISPVDEFLTRHYHRARLIIGIDATASRQPTWDKAAQLQAEMFRAAVSGNLSAQLIYFRGLNGECRASQWFDSAQPLVNAMQRITCQGGHTQIKKVLQHAVREHAKEPIAAIIYIGDMCEETAGDIYAAAREVPVPAFLFQEGANEYAGEIFRRIAEITGGALAQFDNSSAARLADLLKAVAVYATGGVKALATQKSEAATLLLTQIKK